MNSKVTIIVPVFNTAKYLNDCIKSIEKIEFDNFEVLFIDNCSNDGSFQILKKIKNENFRVIRNIKNLGQSYSLNKGIKLSKSPYIAIMDSDDICLPNRLRESYEFLEQNPEYALVSGKSNTINEEGHLLKKRKFTFSEDLIKTRIHLDNPFSHTTIMFRKKAVIKIGGYSKKFKYAQDFDLISKLINRGFKTKIIKKNFTLVRKHNKQQSFKNQKNQLFERYQIILNNIKKKVRINKDVNSLIKFIVFKEDKEFQKKKIIKQLETLKNFTDKIFKKKKLRFYFYVLIFSQPNSFNKHLIFKIIMEQFFFNKLRFYEREIFLRFGKSLFKLIF